MQHLKRCPTPFDDDDDIMGLPDYVVAQADEGVSSPQEDEVPEPTVLRSSSTYKIESILDHKYRKSWKFLVKWSDWPITDATWEYAYSFVNPQTSTVSPIFVEYCTRHGLKDVLSSAKHIIQRIAHRVRELDNENAYDEA
jgi:hypothetical protein